MNRKAQPIIAFALSLMIAPVAAHGGSPCALVITSDQSSNQTTGLISYLQELLDRQAIGARELALMINESEGGALLNPFSEAAAARDHVASVQRAGVQRFLDSGSVDVNKVRAFIEMQLGERARVQVARGEVHKETSEILGEIDMHVVGPGSVVYYGRSHQESYQALFDFSYAMEVMSKPVTQAQWVEIMGSNPSFHGRGENAVERMIKNQKLMLQPDHPIENVTWWSAVEFANRLSSHLGFRPAYDLTQIQWKPGTSAEAGDLVPLRGKLRIVAKGKFYRDTNQSILHKVDGFRLPTSFEQDFLLSNATLSTPPGRAFISAERDSPLNDFAWYSDWAGVLTQAVGSKLPLLVDGKEFFDLFGNVWEWSWSRGEGTSRVHRARVERISVDGDRIVRGGPEKGRYYYEQYGRNRQFPSSERAENIGFRLVRTVGE